MPVGNPATAVAGQAGQMSAAFWNTEVKDALNQTLYQAGTALPISTWVASAGTPNAGSTGQFTCSYVKHGKLLLLGLYAAPSGTGASFGNAGATWTFTLPFPLITGLPAFYGAGRATATGSSSFAVTPVVTSTTTLALNGPTSSSNSTLVSVGQSGVAGTAWTITGGGFGFSFVGLLA